MRQQQPIIDQLELRAVVVTFEDRRTAARYVEETDLYWPMLVDCDRQLYRAYGMGRGRRRDVWGLSSWKVYGRLLAAGRRPQRPTGDTRQLGGNVLIDPQQIVRLHHIGSAPADRPSVDRLLRMIDEPLEPRPSGD